MKSQQSDLVGVFLVLDSTDTNTIAPAISPLQSATVTLRWKEVSEERPLPPMESRHSRS
jgi:hypothetical protein